MSGSGRRSTRLLVALPLLAWVLACGEPYSDADAEVGDMLVLPARLAEREFAEVGLRGVERPETPEKHSEWMTAPVEVLEVHSVNTLTIAGRGGIERVVLSHVGGEDPRLSPDFNDFMAGPGLDALRGYLAESGPLAEVLAGVHALPGPPHAEGRPCLLLVFDDEDPDSSVFVNMEIVERGWGWSRPALSDAVAVYGDDVLAWVPTAREGLAGLARSRGRGVEPGFTLDEANAIARRVQVAVSRLLGIEFASVTHVEWSDGALEQTDETRARYLGDGLVELARTDPPTIVSPRHLEVVLAHEIGHQVEDELHGGIADWLLSQTFADVVEALYVREELGVEGWCGTMFSLQASAFLAIAEQRGVGVLDLLGEGRARHAERALSWAMATTNVVPMSFDGQRPLFSHARTDLVLAEDDRWSLRIRNESGRRLRLHYTGEWFVSPEGSHWPLEFHLTPFRIELDPGEEHRLPLADLPDMLEFLRHGRTPWWTWGRARELTPESWFR